MMVGLRIANFLLFVFSCFMVADIGNRLIEGALTPIEAPPAPAAARTGASEPSWTDRQVILDRNLVGSGKGEPQIDVNALLEAFADQDLEETKLPLTLLGTIASSDQRVASAALQNNASRKHEVVKVGDRLQQFPDVEVIAIHRQRVVLNNKGRREELKIDDEGPAVAARRPPPRRKSRASRRRSRRADRESLQDRLAKLAETGGGRNAAAVFTGGKARPHFEDGEMVGLQLTDLKPDGIYDKLGFLDGDVVTSINGQKIDSPSSSQDLFKALREGESLEAEVLRADGTIETKSIPISEIMKNL